jgi:hypothetical protein
MRFYLPKDTPYIPAGSTPVTVDVDRDGTVAFVDHDPEYELAFEAMGGTTSPHLRLLRKIEGILHLFFVDRDLVSPGVFGAVCRQAVDRLLRGIEEFDVEFVQPYRTRLEDGHAGAVFVLDLVSGLEVRALETFRGRSDLTLDLYSTFLILMKKLLHYVQDVFEDGPIPTDNVAASHVLNDCIRAALHINSIRTIMCPGQVPIPDGQIMLAEQLLQLGDFLDAVQEERDA